MTDVYEIEPDESLHMLAKPWYSLLGYDCLRGHVYIATPPPTNGATPLSSLCGLETGVNRRMMSVMADELEATDPRVCPDCFAVWGAEQRLAERQTT